MEREINPALADLINAVIRNDSHKVNDLLNNGVDPNQSLDKTDIKAMHFAAQNDALTVIPLLVQAGADIEAKTNPDGQTPLDIACLHQHTRTVELLIKFLLQKDPIPN